MLPKGAVKFSPAVEKILHEIIFFKKTSENFFPISKLRWLISDLECQNIRILVFFNTICMKNQVPLSISYPHILSVYSKMQSLLQWPWIKVILVVSY